MKNLNTKKASVIVIENNYLDMLVLRALLGKYVNLCIAPNIELAVKIVSEFNFDMILLDTQTYNKKENSLKFVKANSKNKDMKICGISSLFDGSQSIKNEVFDGILTKPVCKEDIFKILNWQESANIIFSGKKALSTLYSVL